MTHAHFYDAAHFFLRVIGHVALTVAPLNQNELVGSFDDVVLVAQKNYVVVGLDYVGQVFHVAKRAGGLGVSKRRGFRLSYVRVEFYKIDIHVCASQKSGYPLEIALQQIIRRLAKKFFDFYFIDFSEFSYALHFVGKRRKRHFD